MPPEMVSLCWIVRLLIAAVTPLFTVNTEMNTPPALFPSTAITE